MTTPKISRVDPDLQDFEDLIRFRGIPLLWEKAALCPCVDPITQHPNLQCKDCSARGYQYFDAQEIRGVVTGIGLRKNYLETGEWIMGTAMLTVTAGSRLDWHDRLTIINSIARYTELITRGAVGAKDKPKYPIVDTVLVRDEPTSVGFTRNKSFVITPAGEFDWIGAAPVSGVKYSATYTYRPVFIVLDATNEFRDLFVRENADEVLKRFPLRYVIRRDYLVGT